MKKLPETINRRYYVFIKYIADGMFIKSNLSETQQNQQLMDMARELLNEVQNIKKD